ncbi:MAG: oxidoreductase [Cyclobacteriaceae bacterium]|nr:MAG: oxidoreductase [Cyclobacteriaceae bacterium]
MTRIRRNTALITGGASGIGRLMGQRLLELKCSKLVVWDIDELQLNNLTEEWSNQGYEVFPYLVDVANTTHVQEMAGDVLESVGKIDILVNNAGIVIGKNFVDHSTKEIDDTINVNIRGVMQVTRCFLMPMIRSGSGHIVNIASAAGLIPNPRMSVYAASKWAMVGWSESLRLELEQLNRRLRVTTVTPSYIDTGMFKGIKAPLLTPLLDPEEIVEEIIQAIVQDKIWVRSPKIINMLPFLRGILPTRLFDFTAQQLGVYSSMDDFKGRDQS